MVFYPSFSSRVLRFSPKKIAVAFDCLEQKVIAILHWYEKRDIKWDGRRSLFLFLFILTIVVSDFSMRLDDVVKNKISTAVDLNTCLLLTTAPISIKSR